MLSEWSLRRLRCEADLEFSAPITGGLEVEPIILSVPGDVPMTQRSLRELGNVDSGFSTVCEGFRKIQGGISLVVFTFARKSNAAEHCIIRAIFDHDATFANGSGGCGCGGPSE